MNEEMIITPVLTAEQKSVFSINKTGECQDTQIIAIQGAVPDQNGGLNLILPHTKETSFTLLFP